MSSDRILIDYTTLVSAANTLNCASAEYPLIAANPYSSLLSGRKTPPDSPMWLEAASLADLLESVVIHERLCVLDVGANDRNREVGRYVRDNKSQLEMIGLLQRERILEELTVSDNQNNSFQNWISQAVESGTLVTSLLDSLFELLKQPAYSALPDLFSHSQTVYKFDGETIWSRIRERIDVKELSRQFRRRLRENADQIRMPANSMFYPEDILGFFLRGLYYNDIAKAERIPYHPHGGRSPVVMSDGLWAAGATNDYARVPINFVERLRSEIATEVNSATGCELFDLDVPPVLAIVLREAARPEDCVPIALQLRNTSAATAYRQYLQAMGESVSGMEILKLKADLENLKQNFRKEVGLDSATVSVGLWKFSFPVKLPKWMFRSFYLPGKRHLQFVRDLAAATINLQSLENRLIDVFRRA